jgi:hypothetical protein
VTGVQRQRWPEDPDTILNLLAVTVDSNVRITIAFAGGVSLRANAECIDAVLEDLSPAWNVRHKPTHD